MSRRAFTHDYSRPGIYHITIHVTDGMGQPLGAVVGTSADSAAITLTRAGETIKHELTTAITAHYPMITVDEYVIMPDHLHFILIVRDPILTQTGRLDHCAAGSLLLVSPWIYQYRGKNEAITVPFCKTMNCVAQALCRTKDNWWKA